MLVSDTVIVLVHIDEMRTLLEMHYDDVYMEKYLLHGLRKFRRIFAVAFSVPFSVAFFVWLSYRNFKEAEGSWHGPNLGGRARSSTSGCAPCPTMARTSRISDTRCTNFAD